MRKLLPLVYALAGLLAGAVAGYALWNEPPVHQTHRPALVAVAPELAPVEPPPTAAPVEDSPPVAAPETPKTGDSLGAIDGVVRYDDGRPLAGVAIRARPFVLADEGDSVQARLEAFARRRAEERALECVAQTDVEGKFRLEGLDSTRRYALTPQLAGHNFRPERGTLDSFYGNGSSVSFIAIEGGMLTLRLLLPGGQSPDAATIEVDSRNARDAGRIRYWYWTPESSAHAFSVGTWTLQVTAGSNQEFITDATFTVESGRDIPLMTLQLKPRPGVFGRVVPVQGLTGVLRIHLLREVDGRFADPGRGGGTHLWPEHGFVFSFLDAAPGRYRLCVTHGDKAVATHDVVIDEEQVFVEIRMPEPDQKDYIVVRVSSPDGPIDRDVQFHLALVHGNGRSSASAQVLNRGGGEFWLQRDDAKLRQPDGWYEITVISGKYGLRERRYERESTGAIEVRFDPPGFLVVEIAGYEGHDQKDNLRVECVEEDPSAQNQASRQRSRGEGQTGSSRRIGPLEPGRYVVRLRLEDRRASREFVLDSRSIDITAGDNAVTLTAPPLYSITIVVPEEYRKHQLNIVLEGDSEYRQSQRRTGLAEVEFLRLKAGEYRLQALPAGVMRISIPAMAGQRITFAPLPFNALRLLTSPRSTNSDHGLQDGDLLIEIDGVLLETDFEKRHELVSTAAGRESTTWVVIRAGKRVAVTFEGRKWSLSGMRGEAARVD